MPYNEDSGVSYQDSYSQSFLESFRNSALIQGDSIHFISEHNLETVIIPLYLPRDGTTVVFGDSSENIAIKQVNYTDLLFTVHSNGKHFNGKAELDQKFWMGLETFACSDGEFIIHEYNVTESEPSCLEMIGLGNQNLIEEKGEVYALVFLNREFCDSSIHKLAHKKLDRFLE